jgi:hypothetical protein
MAEKCNKVNINNKEKPVSLFREDANSATMQASGQAQQAISKQQGANSSNTKTGGKKK